jgi:Uma2 family endonuclease
LILQPDLFVLPFVDGASLPHAVVANRPLLAVEIVSPSSGRFDRMQRRRAHLGARVPEYWVVDGGSRVIEQWHRTDTRPELRDRDLRWQPAEPEGVDPFTLDIETMFGDARLTPE